MTNLERSTRGITNSALCPRCNLYPESILHLLRDCEIILELWEQIVDPSVWHLFVSLGLERWLEFNVCHQQMGASSLHWPIMFATMIHMLWIDRNHYVFFGKSALLAVFLPKVLGQVTAIHLYFTSRPSILSMPSGTLMFVGFPPPAGMLKLNIDGSCVNGLAACGGLIRDEMGSFICGFYCNLGSSTSIHAELWGLTHGLRIASQMGI